MPYAVGDTISNSDYNGLLNNTASGTPNAGVAARGINFIAGTGATSGAGMVYGLGQTELTAVGSTDLIQAAQWNSLFTFMNNIQNHTNITALTSTTAVSTGDVIQIKSALETDLTALAAAVAGGCTGVSAGALTTSGGTAATQTTEGWDSTSTQELTVTFASANAMRWYFNGGGKVRVTVGTTEATVHGKDQAFKDLGTAIGELDIGSQASTRSGSGDILTTNGLGNGFHDLTTSYTTILKLTSDNTGYTSNTVEIFAKLDAAVGTATVMTIKMVATDPNADTQFDAGNTAGITPTNIKDTPRMVTTLFTLTPNNTEGLTPPNYGPASAAAPALAVLTNNSTT
jgi:hypothetical protein